MGFKHVLIVHEDKKGITHARQMGLRCANTKWVAFIDADNELPEGWYERAAKTLIDGKDIVALSGPPQFQELLIFARLAVFGFYCVGKLLHNFAPMLQGGNFIVDRAILLSLGGFDTSVEFYGEDTATAIRLAEVGKVKFDLGLYCLSSARRLVAEGFWHSGARYAMNYAWMWIVGRPWTRTHSDHRETEPEQAA